MNLGKGNGGILAKNTIQITPTRFKNGAKMVPNTSNMAPKWGQAAARTARKSEKNTGATKKGVGLHRVAQF